MADFEVVIAGGHFGWWCSKAIYPFNLPVIFRVDEISKTKLFMRKPRLRLSNGLFLRPDNL